MSSIPEEFREILEEKKTYASLATFMPDGFPHITPVWVDYDADGDRVLVNTERERQKELNVRRDSRAGLLAPDPDDPYRWVSVSGEVDELTEEGARDHIDELAQRYMGVNDYPNPIQTSRVILKIRPEHVWTFEA